MSNIFVIVGAGLSLVLIILLVKLIGDYKIKQNNKKIQAEIAKNIESNKLKELERKRFEEFSKRENIRLEDEERVRKVKRNEELRIKKEQDLKRKLEEEIKRKQQRELIIKEEQECKLKKEQESKLKQEQESKLKQEQELRHRNEDREIGRESEKKIINYRKDIRYFLDDISRSVSSKIYFRKFSLNNFTGYYLFDYISNYNLESFNNPIYRKIRNEIIFPFKEGNNLGIHDSVLIFSILDINTDIYCNSEYYLCVIPSSKREKNILRFESLVNKVSAQLQINDGFNLISRNIDRDDTRVTGKNHDVLQGVVFSEKLKGKRIILIDDVTTKGTSMIKFNEHLKRIGCVDITNVFFAKTFFSNTLLKENEMNEFNINNFDFYKRKYKQ